MLSFPTDVDISLTLSSVSRRKGHARVVVDWNIPPLKPECAVVNQTVSVQQLDLDNCESASGLMNRIEDISRYRRHYKLIHLRANSEYNVTLAVTTRSGNYKVWKTIRLVETGKFS